MPDSEARSPLPTIADVAGRLGVSRRALRFYEQRGLVRPVRIGNYRHYSDEDVDRLAIVLKLKFFGFSLLQIAEILKKPGDGPFGLTAQQCEAQLHFLHDQIADMQKAVAELERFCSQATG